MLRFALIFSLAGCAALATAGSALAVSPTLFSVGQTSRHLTASFSAREAATVSVDVATSPEVATDGQFLDENIADSDYLTDNEIQSGHWLAQDQIDPGTYYVMLDASADPIQCTRPDFSTDPSCADGTSNIRRVKVPTPVTHYAATTHLYTFVNTIELTLTARPLGDKEPYEVCWKDKARQTKCLKGTLNGYDWDSSADDELMTTTKGLAPRTKFTWTRTGRHPKRLVAKTVRTPTSKF